MGDAKTITRKHLVDVLDRSIPPALRVQPEDLVIVDCIDGYGGDIKGPEQNASNLSWETMNPCTGPIYVEGAEAGDTLAVDILSIEVGPEGYAVTFPDCGLLCDEIEQDWTTVGKVLNNRVVVPYTNRASVPVRPLIGTFGVAPAGDPVPTVLSGDHGGNMDHNMVTAGSTVYLPVSAPGALLAMGDAKAAMGDGELTAESLEIDILALLRPRVLKNHWLTRPMIESRTEICTCACRESFREALKQALRDMVAFLQRKLNLSWGQAYHLAGLTGSMRPGNLVNDTVCVSVVAQKESFHGGLSVA